MDINYNAPKTSHPGRAFLGFFLSFIIFVLLVGNGFLISLKTSVLNGNDVNSLLENSGFYTTMQNAVVDELYKNTESLGISQDALNELFPEDTIADVAETITDALSGNESVDLSYMKDDCMNIAKTTSETAVDTVFDSFENSSKVFDAKTLAENPVIKQLEADYGVNVTDTIINEMENKFGTTSVDLTTVDSAEVKAMITDTLTDKVYPAIDNAFDEYVGKANNLINESISTMNNEFHMDNIFRMVEDLLNMLTVAIIILIVLIVALFLIEMLVYKTSLHRAFRNFSISALLSGGIIFAAGMVLKFIMDMIFDKYLNTRDSIETIIKDFMESNISSVNNMIIAVGVVYIILFVVFLAISSAIKKKTEAR